MPGTAIEISLVYVRPFEHGYSHPAPGIECIPPRAAVAVVAVRQDGKVEQATWSDGTHELLGHAWSVKIVDSTVTVAIR